MSLAVDVTAEGVRVPLSRAAVADLVRGVLRAEKVRSATVSVTFLAPAAMARLNREHLGHRGPTDVITFALGAGPGGAPVVGDVYICPDVIRENARANGVGIREELARVVVHGALHTLGYEHPEDESRTASPMWRRQEALLRRLRTAARA